jgi:hypothetical protein
MTKNHQNGKLDKVAEQKPEASSREELARPVNPSGNAHAQSSRANGLSEQASQPAAELHHIPKAYEFEQSENEGAALADVAFDAVEHAFKKRAQERAQRFVALANATMASFANGMAARSAEIRTTYLPDNYGRPELPQGEEKR